jgi:hypothetical protein
LDVEGGSFLTWFNSIRMAMASPFATTPVVLGHCHTTAISLNMAPAFSFVMIVSLGLLLITQTTSFNKTKKALSISPSFIMKSEGLYRRKILSKSAK